MKVNPMAPGAAATHQKNYPCLAFGIAKTAFASRPIMATPVEVNPRITAESWLSSFASALSSGDACTVAALFLPHGWLRDVLTFTWDNRSLEGREKIIGYLAGTLQTTSISEVKMHEDKHFQPAFIPGAPEKTVEFGYTFETPIAHGQGLARLLQDEQQTWKALIVSTIIIDLKGHEETPGRINFEDLLQDICWGVAETKRRIEIETDPHVIILGAGQTGLNVAARFKQMNIPTLVVERNKRVGDNWRHRYLSLALHLVREHNEMLYHRYPSTWPVYIPRDKIADTLEVYAVQQNLVVWTNSTPKGQPVYDAGERKWTITIDHNGTEVVLHPVHIVLATGSWAGAHIPSLPGGETFKGVSLHSTQYNDPREYTGKDVVVVGAGNSAIDICQDLVGSRASSVTMIQRSSTCVVSRENINKAMSEKWRPEIPTEVADFKSGSVPLGFLRKLMISRQEEAWAEEAPLHAKLRKGGVKLNMGPEGEGQLVVAFDRGGGFWLDKGGAALIESGDIKVKQGTEPTLFTPTGLRFADGSELPAEVVIFATGYSSMHDVNKELFGAETMQMAGEASGLDEEWEGRGGWRPTGHPGLWYGSGSFFKSRFHSKSLAIMIKALELESWLASFASALSSGDARAVAALFLRHGWLRDILTFTWDNRALEGRENIVSYLAGTLTATYVAEVKMLEDKYFQPSFIPGVPKQTIEFGYAFETPVARGRGLVQLMQDEDDAWRALIVSTVITDLRGHEETLGRLNFEDSVQDVCWSESEAKRRAQVESDPQVIILGGGQTGLNIAARFKQMNIPTLVVERTKRIGDSWRHRYLSLVLHTTREFNPSTSPQVRQLLVDR
ncbi:hypothetical protein NM688_g5899 [Phlebia brevispora]|uniref:Uncharacterized protein n=1 Tax=Phlebia brevispora TaxID=194682 RepID=A0ACC1SNE8_9APHY|nr:hypothetical protein NM688_g5899 [Phlebia brevispora]